MIGDYRAAREFGYFHRVEERDMIRVPIAGPVHQALAGLSPEEVTIVLVHGSARWVDDRALAHIERFRALGAQLLVME